MSDALPTLRARLDRFGVILSGLCLIHCVAGVFLVGVLGIGGGVLLDPDWHRWGLAFALVIGALTIGLGALRHGRFLPLMVGSTGLALMGGAVAVGHGTEEVVLTVIGVVLVAAAHVINIRTNACHS
ncbi:MAG: MerC domain-containing protein [Novosphingobium sp.]|uniref:MerC domain-containing protein n=1 Tax=Novosphingobium sp. TaxID=1874826 RepID=UPI002736F089|nr:MerC domain-containing protein [Novosphingobium sp.]MDP3550744.1 MerC domain-containing protein [Novosphingobium sp.]